MALVPSLHAVYNVGCNLWHWQGTNKGWRKLAAPNRHGLQMAQLKVKQMATKQTKAPKAATKAPKAATPKAAQQAATKALLAVAQPVAVAAPVAVAQPAAPQAVSLRGGIAATTVALTAKPYRVGATHNVQWWQAVCAAIAAGGGTATVASLLLGPNNPTGVPGHFLGYVVRRGYLQAA